MIYSKNINPDRIRIVCDHCIKQVEIRFLNSEVMKHAGWDDAVFVMVRCHETRIASLPTYAAMSDTGVVVSFLWSHLNFIESYFFQDIRNRTETKMLEFAQELKFYDEILKDLTPDKRPEPE